MTKNYQFNHQILLMLVPRRSSAELGAKVGSSCFGNWQSVGGNRGMAMIMFMIVIMIMIMIVMKILMIMLIR